MVMKGEEPLEQAYPDADRKQIPQTPENLSWQVFHRYKPVMPCRLKEKDCRYLTGNIQIHSDGILFPNRADFLSLKYYPLDFHLKNEYVQYFDKLHGLLYDDYGEQYYGQRLLSTPGGKQKL